MSIKKISKKELLLLKQKLPRKYNELVRKAYLEQVGEEISERVIYRFFSGTTYSSELHNAALHVAEVYQNELTILRKRTGDLINS